MPYFNGVKTSTNDRQHMNKKENRKNMCEGKQKEEDRRNSFITSGRYIYICMVLFYMLNDVWIDFDRLTNSTNPYVMIHSCRLIFK
jgi:hypothetical protein